MMNGLRVLQRTLVVRTGAWTGALSTAPFWLYLFLVVLSALPVFLLTRSLTDEVEHGRFVAAAEQAVSRLAHEVDLTFANLRAVEGLYKGSVHVSRDEFSAFVQALSPRETVQSLEWIPRVFASGRAEYEEAAREDGFPDFQFREYNPEGAFVPATARPEYFPVYYLEPHHEGDGAFGLDLSSSPVGSDVLRRARDSGRKAASGRVRLSPGPEGQFGILVVEPIFAEEALDLDARIERLEGFARGVFRISDLVHLAFPEDLFQVAVFDLTASPQERQIFPAAVLEEGQVFRHDVSLDIADRTWSVRLAPAAASALSTLPWLAAATWLGVLLVLWTVRELLSSRRHSEQLAAINHRLEAISDERQQAIKELERSNRELDDFAYIASHDLKEPLRAVHNHAAFLLEDYESKLPEDGGKRLRRLMTLSEKMQKLIGDLLYYSRLGRGELAAETVDLNEVIADIEASLSEALHRQNAKVVLAKPLPPVQGHRPHITALFQNLISNGIKYNDRAKKVIEIGLLQAERSGSGDFETFYVRDNGIGIDESFKDDVFRIFKRLNGEKAYGEGTGAGLSFVKKIVENQGGTIALNSTPGEGSTFIFTLKRSTTPVVAAPRLQAA